MKQREIKFRGMDIMGRWFIGLLSISQGKNGQPPAGCYISNSAGQPWAYQVRPETVGQFTGLLDKNGKEIYEGDRLRYVFLEVISGGIREPEAKFITVENILRFDVMRAISDTDEVEIIGNIYQHPELLTK